MGGFDRILSIAHMLLLYHNVDEIIGKQLVGVQIEHNFEQPKERFADADPHPFPQSRRGISMGFDGAQLAGYIAGKCRRAIFHLLGVDMVKPFYLFRITHVLETIEVTSVGQCKKGRRSGTVSFADALKRRQAGEAAPVSETATPSGANGDGDVGNGKDGECSQSEFVALLEKIMEDHGYNDDGLAAGLKAHALVDKSSRVVDMVVPDVVEPPPMPSTTWEQFQMDLGVEDSCSVCYGRPLLLTSAKLHFKSYRKL